MSDSEKYGWNHNMLCDSTAEMRAEGYTVSFVAFTKAEILWSNEKFAELDRELMMRIANKEI